MKKSTKNISFYTLAFMGGLALMLVVGVQAVFAQTSCEASPYNTCSWAWNDQIGWIQHNSIDDPSVPLFGVHIDESTEEVSGHAWNDILGYIDFAGANYAVLTGQLSGTAQILDLGVDGAVLLRGDCSPSCGGYGVDVNPDGSVTGYAWNDSIGWIDFAPDSGGVFHNNEQNPSMSGWAWNDSYGWIAMRFTEYDPEWGVHLGNDGNFTGYAWNDNIGWIDYNPAGPYPAAPNYSVRWDPVTEEVSGWALSTNLASIGHNGWILLRDSSGDISYGVSLSRETGDWSGWGWNDEMGWISYANDFSFVHTDFVPTPPETPYLIEPVDCVDTYDIYPSNPLTPTLQWSDYFSGDGSLQESYRIQVDDDPLFGSLLVDETVDSTSSAYNVGLGVIDYNVTYYWRAQVKSTEDKWSEWGEEGEAGESNCFRTPIHPAPACDFTTIPAVPALAVPTYFVDYTQTYGGAAITEWTWDFGDGEVLTGSDPAVNQNPEHTYEKTGPTSVSLTAVDSDGYECTEIQDFEIKESLPEIKKVIPR